jgi:hypothetical protein
MKPPAEMEMVEVGESSAGIGHAGSGIAQGYVMVIVIR